jgi:hypothetical protein
LQMTRFHFSLWMNKIPLCIIPHFLNPSISCGTSGLFPNLGYCE